MQEQIETFLAFLAARKGRRPNTIAAYRTDLTQFDEFLQQFPPHLPALDQPQPVGESHHRAGEGVAGQEKQPGIHETQMQAFLHYLQEERRYAPTTVNRKMAAVSSFLRYLAQESGPRAAQSTVRRPKVERAAPKAMTPQEVQRLLAVPAQALAQSDLSPKSEALLQRDQAILELLYATGMRISELVALDVADLDGPGREVRCGQDGEQIRAVPVDGTPLRHAQRYLTQARPRLAGDESGQALFLNHRRSRITRQGVWLLLRSYVEQAGIATPVTPQTLRHTVAIHMLNRGASLDEVQQRLGHASPLTTQAYEKLPQTAPPRLVIDGQAVEGG